MIYQQKTLHGGVLSHPFIEVTGNGNAQDRYVIYTDGSCLDNGRPNARAGFGIYIPEIELRQMRKLDPKGNQTNQRAELEAVKAALEVAFLDQRVPEIRTDSQYVIKGLTEYSIKWLQQGWPNAPVQNKDLFKAIIDMAQESGRTVCMKYVQGHSKESGNEVANALAKQAAEL